MADNCMNCNLNTVGQHEPSCPLWQGYVSVATYRPEVDQPTDADCKPQLEYNMPNPAQDRHDAEAEEFVLMSRRRNVSATMLKNAIAAVLRDRDAIIDCGSEGPHPTCRLYAEKKAYCRSHLANVAQAKMSEADNAQTLLQKAAAALESIKREAGVSQAASRNVMICQFNRIQEEAASTLAEIRKVVPEGKHG